MDKNRKQKKKAKTFSFSLKDMDKKKVILTSIVILLFLLVFFLSYLVLYKYVLKRSFEEDVLSFASKNEKTIFEIDKITFFSSCDAKNKSASSSNFTIENLYQYTDIALSISSPLEEKTLENTLKEVSIENIQYTKVPEQGTPNLYYKNIYQFAKSSLPETPITDRLDFAITSDDEASLDTPTLYNNLANPIVLSYVNQNIKTDYTLTDTSNPITYDGSLLKKCNVLLNPISCSLSFDINITNHLDQKFTCKVYLDIPLETDDQSIYDGSVTVRQDTNYRFYRYQ